MWFAIVPRRVLFYRRGEMFLTILAAHPDLKPHPLLCPPIFFSFLPVMWVRMDPEFLGFLAAARKGGQRRRSNHDSLLLVYLEPNPERGCGGQVRGV
jgi:hypothetical protein